MCWFFFVKEQTAYEMRIRDWSSDVCSSDLRSGGLKRWLVLHPVPRQEFAEAVLRDVGDAGEDVGKQGLGSISLSLAVVIRLNMKVALHARIDRADLVLSPVATRLDQAVRWLAARGEIGRDPV